MITKSPFLLACLITLVVGNHHHEKDVRITENVKEKLTETLTEKETEDLTDRTKRTLSTFPVVRFGIPSHLEKRSKSEEVKKEPRSVFQQLPSPGSHSIVNLAPNAEAVPQAALYKTNSEDNKETENKSKECQIMNNKKIYNILDMMGKCLKHPDCKKSHDNKPKKCKCSSSSSSSCSSSSSSSSNSKSRTSSSCDSNEYDYQFKYCYGKKGTKANMQFPY